MTHDSYFFLMKTFWITLAACVIFYGWRTVHLLPLINGETRQTARTALANVADREGWLLSDVIVKSVTDDRMELTYRQHHRGRDPKQCYTLIFADNSLHPCD